ncbi:ribosome recycling factor [Candidatus Peregrinibacteria bacterium]|nr:ribosome recycling factor [Candidatus Peregrinibacteria bacterium]
MKKEILIKLYPAKKLEQLLLNKYFMSYESAITGAVNEFKKAIDHLKSEFARLQVGRASSLLVENIPVDVYGVSQPIKAIASISVPDPKTIQIQPWDKNNLAPIEKAIVGIGTGLNPVNDGVLVRISIPPLTEERRTELSKHVGKLSEEAKITVRQARQDAHNEIKDLKTRGEITEDDMHSGNKKLQERVDEANAEIDDLTKQKEQDVMTV